MITITPLAIPEVLIITPKRHGDARGWFTETWSRKTLADQGIEHDFVQDNQAYSQKAGTIRGLHFQTAPRITRSSLAWAWGAVWKCRPRMVPAFWL